MTILLVEDNPSIRQFLLQVIPTLGSDYQIIGTCSTVQEALTALRMQQPDLLILDVELPDGRGFDILQNWNEEHKQDRFTGSVIFATAYNHYALQAIKFSALDYLLKPIDVTELKAALEKAAKHKIESSRQFLEDKITVLQQNLSKVETEQADKTIGQQKIVISDAERIYLVTVNEIIRCEANGSYTLFCLANDKRITISKSIKQIEQMLPVSLFYRIHRSHLINLTFFDFLDRKDGGTVHLKDGSTLPIALRRKDTLLEKLQGL